MRERFELRHEPLHYPGRTAAPELDPPQPRHALHRPITGRWVLTGAEGELAERAPGSLGALQPGEDARPGGEVVQRRETLPFQEAGEFEAIVQAEVWCNLRRRTDGATTQEHRLDHRSGPERQIRTSGANVPHDRVQSHSHQNK